MSATILIAEDEESISTLIADFLNEYHDFQVVDVVNTGEKAIEAYKKHKPDVVIMDLIMPKLSGKKAIESILTIDPKAKIIIITAIIDSDFRHTMLKKGVKKYLEKPFRLDDLVESVMEVAGIAENNAVR